MNIWLIILLAVLLVLFAVIRLIKPTPVPVSVFEIRRRVREGDEQAALWESRLRTAPLLLALRAFASLLITYGIYGVLDAFFNGWVSAFLTVVLVVSTAWLTRLAPVIRLRKRLYERAEPRLLRLERVRRYFFFLPPEAFETASAITSEPELVHTIDGMTFLGGERRTLIRAALEFTGLSVRDAMSGRRAIHAIDKGEVLGPLVLDELYKTGRSTFVVTDGGLDAIVGILHLDRLTSLDLKDTPTALAAMSPDVHVIDADAPITDGVAYLRSAKAPFLVVQDDGRTVGLLSMDNILRCLFETGD